MSSHALSTTLRKAPEISQRPRPRGPTGQKHSPFRKYNLVPTQFASLGKEKNGPGLRRLAYCKIEGTKRPGIIYVPGYFSKMYIAKANVLEDFCMNNGYSFLKYDPEGIGESPKSSSEVSFAEWFEDACYVLQHLTDGPQILVSASNGGWMSLLLAQKFPERIHSLLMMGPGVNHGLDDDLFDKLISSLDEETARRVNAGETVKFQSNWGVTVTASKRFVDELNQFRLDMSQSLDLPNCPVRIIHSIQDQSVYWENTLRLMQAIGHDDVRLYLKKRGNHRLMTDEDLYLEISIIEELVSQYPVEPPEPETSEPEAAPEEPSRPQEPDDGMAAVPQHLMDHLMDEMGKRMTVTSSPRALQAAGVRSKL